ncbi:MAG: hypothetical protein Q8868_13155 [Bacteroidota bacterium]|nr:hypothetical protein [Bacteroidota bacterium]
MSSLDLIVILFVGLVLIFGIGRIVGHVCKIDKYLEEIESKSSDLTITARTREGNQN